MCVLYIQVCSNKFMYTHLRMQDKYNCASEAQVYEINNARQVQVCKKNSGMHEKQSMAPYGSNILP